MSSKRLLPLLSLLLFLPAAACDKASPVAPTGTTLTISANPTKIGLNGESTVTVVGRKPDGNPLNPGTEIRFSTDRGTITPIAEVGAGGVATTTFRADGRTGAAVITATTGAGDVTATANLQIGETDETRPTLIVSMNPNNLRVGETGQITVVARNPDGSPVAAGQEVILTSTLGTIRPSRPKTGADGTATATFDSGDRAGTATITAILGSSQAVTTDVTIRDFAEDIDLAVSPTSVSAASGGMVQLTATVTNAQGELLPGAPVFFEIVGPGGFGAFAVDGVVVTDSRGRAENTLTLTTQDLQGKSVVVVRAFTPSATDEEIEAEERITVN